MSSLFAYFYKLFQTCYNVSMYLSNALRGISSFPQEPEPALVLPIAFCLTSIRIVRSETRMITEHSFIVSISVSFFNSISAFAFSISSGVLINSEISSQQVLMNFAFSLALITIAPIISFHDTNFGRLIKPIYKQTAHALRREPFALLMCIAQSDYRVVRTRT